MFTFYKHIPLQRDVAIGHREHDHLYRIWVCGKGQEQGEDVINTWSKISPLFGWREELQLAWVGVDDEAVLRCHDR